VRRRVVWAVVASAASSWGCTPSPAELPAVAAAPLAISECTPDQYGREVVPITNAGDRVADCAEFARREGCEGAVDFDVEVDELGRSAIVAWRGRRAPPLRECLEAAIRQAALGPATDCRGVFLTSRTRGTLAWNLGQYGTAVKLANVAGAADGLSASCLEKGKAAYTSAVKR
jgi:hypothetical protein